MKRDLLLSLKNIAINKKNNNNNRIKTRKKT